MGDSIVYPVTLRKPQIFHCQGKLQSVCRSPESVQTSASSESSHRRPFFKATVRAPKICQIGQQWQSSVFSKRNKKKSKIQTLTNPRIRQKISRECSKLTLKMKVDGNDILVEQMSLMDRYRQTYYQRHCS